MTTTITGAGFAASQLTGALPAISGASLTGVGIQSGVAVATTSGTSIDFTGIPAGVKRVTFWAENIRTTGTSYLRWQLRTGSEATTSGYLCVTNEGGAAGQSSTSGFDLYRDTAARTAFGAITFTRVGSGDMWAMTWLFGFDSSYINKGVGMVTLSGALDGIRLTTAGGSDTYNLGNAGISWEF